MRVQLIATLVGGVIIFLWQFLSWSFLNVHASEIRYTPKQDDILQVLSENLEEGHYFLPTVAPGTPMDEREAAMEAFSGKPWAMVSYHDAMNTNMGMNMFRGFVADLFAAFLLVWVLMGLQRLNFRTAILASLAVGITGYLTIPYLTSIWFETNSIGYLIDTIVQWGLVGAWLGWYLPGRSTTPATGSE